MAKKKKKLGPKKIAGVKLSKGMRKRIGGIERFSRTQFGGSLMAQATVVSATALLTNDKVKAAAADAFQDVRRAAQLGWLRVNAALQAAREEPPMLDDTRERAPGDEAPERAKRGRRARAQGAETEEPQITTH